MLSSIGDLIGMSPAPPKKEQKMKECVMLVGILILEYDFNLSHPFIISFQKLKL